jgi:aspartokinase/homoserine dehydrogenase 1
MMKVLKFGGSSVSSGERMEKVVDILLQEEKPYAVVVSAMGGVTDLLIQTAKKAAVGDKDYYEGLYAVEEKHQKAIDHLFCDIPASLQESYEQGLSALQDFNHGIFLLRELSLRSLDLIMSFGEQFSAMILAHALSRRVHNACYLDAREFIVTDNHFGNARVAFQETNAAIKAKWAQGEMRPVITGFIGATKGGETTTLGRGGSDYTAAIVGAALDAHEVEIWTDVDGVMTADPRKVKEAKSLLQMSYKEALEISHFGAKVLYPPTVAPLLKKEIPLRIKNTFHPAFDGTWISKEPHSSASGVICGLSSIDAVALMRLEGSGMVGVAGTAMRLFAALAKDGINVILISQGSSEHSICFAIVPEAASLAKQNIEQEFALELQAQLIDPVVVEQELSIIAVVGEKMRQTSGLAGKLFGALGDHNINVIAIAQGSSEYNISLVIKRSDVEKGLNVIHATFFKREEREEIKTFSQCKN